MIQNWIVFAIFLVSFIHCKKKSTTIVPVGTWSSWGPWAPCTKTCGIGVRRRTRTCSYGGPVEERRCKGPTGQLKNCDTKVMCPIHGGWTPWTSWRCTASCGGGEGSQRRTCTNPTPMYGGQNCEGLAEEFGRCNTHKCPDEIFTLSPDVLQAIKNAEQENHNFEKPIGTTVKLPCSESVVNKIYAEYPMTRLSWTKDGEVLKLDHERMELIPTELSIEKLDKVDSGIYVCSIQYVSQVVKRVTVVALSVVSQEPDVKVHEDEKLVLSCRGALLSKIYGNTTRQWLLDGKVIKDFGKDSKKHRKYEVKSVKKNMTGRWTCKIKHPESGKEWTTSIVIVKVLPQRSMLMKILSNKKLLIVIGLGILGVMMSAGIAVAYIIVKARDDFKEDFEKWKQVVEWEEAKRGGVPLSEFEVEAEESSGDDSGDDFDDVEEAGESENNEDALLRFSD